MAINLESLKTQLAQTEVELEQAKAHLYRCDGVVQMLKHLIAQAEIPETPASDDAVTPAKAN